MKDSGRPPRGCELRPTRRQAIGGLLAGMAAAGAPRRLRAEDHPLLVAEEGWARLGPEPHPETAIWGYGGSVPGPVIRVRQGERLVRGFRNDLPQPSTVHWHGIRIANAMDGVPGLTQDAVEPGAAFRYDFALPDAGTYWYHPHNRTWEQMARGLYGALVVAEVEGAPDVDADEVLLIDDWRLTETAQISEDFDSLHDRAHGGRLGTWITVNGDGAWQRMVRRFARVRLRLVNTANARIFSLGTIGLTGWVVALDGMPLDVPEPLDRIVLAPAQRADLVVDVTAEDGEEAFLVSHEHDGGYAIATFGVEGAAGAERRAPPSALPANPLAAPGPLGAARRVDLIMEGGAMGGMRGARLGGRMMDARALADAGKVWAMNGMADMPDAPLVRADHGETVRIALGNRTQWPHAMHLHGHHFRRVSADGTLGPWRDTILVAPEEDLEIAFVADNPGDWLLHCHMLEHAASGMMSWLQVS